MPVETEESDSGVSATTAFTRWVISIVESMEDEGVDLDGD